MQNISKRIHNLELKAVRGKQYGGRISKLMGKYEEILASEEDDLVWDTAAGKKVALSMEKYGAALDEVECDEFDEALGEFDESFD